MHHLLSIVVIFTSAGINVVSMLVFKLQYYEKF